MRYVPSGNEMCIKSSYFDRIGWLRRREANANLGLNSIIMGIPCSRWGAHPFIVHPIPYPENYLATLNAVRRPAPRRIILSQNLVLTALTWRSMMEADRMLTMAKIARNMGISRARVTQIMNLLDLPREILSHVSSLTAREDILRFSERKLRSIHAKAGTAARLAAFRRLCRQTASSPR